MQDELVVTLKKIAVKYGASPKQVQQWIRKGFPAFKIEGSGAWRVRHSRAMDWFGKQESSNACQ